MRPPQSFTPRKRDGQVVRAVVAFWLVAVFLLLWCAGCASSAANLTAPPKPQPKSSEPPLAEDWIRVPGYAQPCPAGYHFLYTEWITSTEQNTICGRDEIAFPAVVALSTCRRIIVQRPTSTYDARFGRGRIGAADTAVRIAYAPVTFSPRADTLVDPFHCGEK